MRRTKDEKKALTMEAARLAKAHLANRDWTPENIDLCERLASRYLGHTKGCRSSDLRSAPKVCEIASMEMLDHTPIPVTYIRA